MAMEQVALMKNVSFDRLDTPVRALTDGVCIASLENSSLLALYNLFLEVFDGCAVRSLIVRMRQYHYVTLVFNNDGIILLDSQRN